MPHITHPKGRGVKTVTVKTIESKEHRYPTTGDWVYDPATETLEIYVTRTGDWRESMAVAFHELCEALLCVQHGVNPDDVDDFDKRFEARRDLKIEDDDAEPGDDPRAPYYLEHQVATSVEHILATHLGLHWPTYNENLGAAGEFWDNQPKAA